ncbi:MAG: efflux RND transporter periplasmic adaptor subunit [Deltaproteobacteria bacterium]|nr:efflux RND transporter periplasmic adaptor subunit [Deltaproteobacteria bacterium]
MKPAKAIPIVLILAVAAGITYYFLYYRSIPWTAIETSGHIEVTDVDLSFRLPGHVTRLLVDEGYIIKKGELVAELRQEVIQAKRDQAAAQVRELEARLASMDLGIKIKEDVVNADLKKAQAGVSASAARFLSLKTGSRKEEINEAAATTEKARTEMENRGRDFERNKNLYSKQIISASQYEDSRTAAESARASYLASLERYRMVKIGPREEMITEGEANLMGSEATMAEAEAAKREVDKMKLDYKALQAQSDQAKAVLAQAEDDLVNSRLFAPFDGFVTVKSVEEKEYVQAGTPIVTIAQLDQVWVKTYIPETDLGRVKLGQPAQVISDSYAKTYEGVVTFISPQAEFTPKNVQTKEERIKLVYRIKVTLANPHQELKPGMPVDVRLK